ncbi:MAG: hypothetical protein LW865_15685 [Betaproteobacteria bacterium]|jgi:hypothetical protein|nr:hypothetical protein [Betaproteobacteria bacterium]
MNKDLVITKGKTFTRVVRWEGPPFVYKAISAIPNTAPATVTANAHGIPDGWRVAIVSVQGMNEINALNDPPSDSDYHQATVESVNAVSFNDINPAEFGVYSSGGYLKYPTPVSLAGFTARMTIRSDYGGDSLLELTSSSGITLDDTAKTITVTITAAQTAAFAFTGAVYDLELVSGSGVVTELLRGAITVLDEATT